MFTFPILFYAAVFLLCPSVVLCDLPDAQVEFDPPRGVYEGSLRLTLTSPFTVPGFIKYTINSVVNSVPTFASLTVGTNYTGPILIDRTCLVTAMAFTTQGLVASNISFHSYVFPADVILQSEVNQATVNKQGYNRTLGSLYNIPHLLLTGPVYPCCDTGVTRVGTSQWIDPNHKKQHWVKHNEYVAFGGSSSRYPKRPIRIEFHGYLPGGGWLEFEGLFDYDVDKNIRSTRRYKRLQIRISGADSQFAIDIDPPTVFVRGIWNDMLMHDANLNLPHTRLVHHYFNNRYLGVVNLREFPDSHFLSEYLGGNASDYDSVHNGDFHGVGANIYSQMLANPRMVYLNNYINWESFFTFIITQAFTGNFDISENHNWHMVGANGVRYTNKWQGRNGGWMFYQVDTDVAMTSSGGAYQPPLTGFDANIATRITGMGNIFNLLISERHPEFMLKFQDYQHKLYIRKNGLLSATNNRNRFDRIFKEFNLNQTMLMEFARWGTPTTCGGMCWMTMGFTFDLWTTGINFIFDSWIPVRQRYWLPQYQALGWTNTIGAVAFDLDDSLVAEKTVLTITANASKQFIVYSTDGQDPRLFGGALTANAINASSPVKLDITDSTIVHARIYDAGKSAWGVLDSVTLLTQPPNKGCRLCGNIILTEINYHPNTSHAPTVQRGPDGSFIEFKNIGNTSLVLTGATLKGMKYTFPVAVLQPNKFYIVARSYEDFQKVYGYYPNDTFTGILSHDSDRVRLLDVTGTTVQDVSYLDKLPFSKLADGYGFTYVARAESYLKIAYALDKSDVAKYYRLSSTVRGSPFADDPPMPSSRNLTLVINEVSASLDNPSRAWVELYNPTSIGVSLWGWDIRRKYDSVKSDSLDYYRLNGTTDSGVFVQPNSYQSINLPFQINFTDDATICVFAAEMPPFPEVNQTPINNMEFICQDISPGVPTLTKGLIPLSTGGTDFNTLVFPSRNARNPSPFIPAVVISAVGYQQPPTGAYAPLQFIKLTNVGSAAVNIGQWTLGIGKKSLQAPFVFPSGTSLNPGQSLFLLNRSTTTANFRYEFDVPANSVFLAPFNASTLLDKITLRQYFVSNNIAYTSNVDGVPVDEFTSVLLAKSNLPANVPIQLERKLTPAPPRFPAVAIYAGDIAAWQLSTISLASKLPTFAPTEFPTEAPTDSPTPPTESPTESPSAAPTPPTEAPTREPTAPVAPTEQPTGQPTQASAPTSQVNRQAANVTWEFADRQTRSRSFQDVRQFISPALHTTTRYFLTDHALETFQSFKKRSGEHSLQAPGSESWTASITATDASTTIQAEADALAAWLRGQPETENVRASSSSSPGASLSQLAVVSIVLGTLILFLLIVWAVVVIAFATQEPPQSHAVSASHSYEML